MWDLFSPHLCKIKTARQGAVSRQSQLYSGPQVAHVIFPSFYFQWHCESWLISTMSNRVPGNEANSSIVKGDFLGNNSKPYVSVSHPSWLTPKHWQSLLSFSLLFLSLTHTNTFHCTWHMQYLCWKGSWWGFLHFNWNKPSLVSIWGSTEVS